MLNLKKNPQKNGCPVIGISHTLAHQSLDPSFSWQPVGAVGGHKTKREDGTAGNNCVIGNEQRANQNDGPFTLLTSLVVDQVNGACQKKGPK